MWKHWLAFSFVRNTIMLTNYVLIMQIMTYTFMSINIVLQYDLIQLKIFTKI